MRKIYFLLVMGLLITNFMWGQINMTTTGTHTQNFDALANSGTTNAWTDNSTIPNWYSQRTGSGTTYAADAGTATAGNMYSYGTGTATERAIGSTGSGNAAAGSFAYGVFLRNTSGTTITDIKVTYTLEEWRKSGVTVAQDITFYYKISSSTFTALNPNNNTGWIQVTGLTLSSPVNTATASALDGNATANRVTATNVAIPGLSLANNEYIMLKWEDPDHTGTDHGLGIDDVTISWTVSSGTPDITLSSPNPAIAAGNLTEGSLNNPIYRFDLAVSTANAILNGVTINTSGTYAASDLVNLKCWYSADNTFNAASDVLLSTKTTSLGTGAHVFPGFTNQSITNGNTGYIFITADMACGATVNNTLSVNAITTADISFSSGNKTGTAFAGGTQTVAAGTPNNVTGAAATNGNAQSSVSWANPTGCYNEIMIVASAGAANNGTPTGDGTAYTANLAFGSGTALGNGFVVYKGSTSPQVVTALTNGTTYHFKIFTRLGTTWSSGVEVNATPAAASSTTDHFRSAPASGSGNWNAVGSWESSPNGLDPWIAATLTPTSAANTITIRNGHTISVSASVTADQLVVETGGVLAVNASQTLTIANGISTDLRVNGVFNNSGSVLLQGSTSNIIDGTFNNSGVLTINSSSTNTVNGVFIANAGGSIANSGSISFAAGSQYNHTINGGTVPTATWDATSTCNVTGMTSTSVGGLVQTFGNFTWNCTGQSTFMNVNNSAFGTTGALTIANTGAASNFCLSQNSATPASHGFGSINVTGGVFQITQRSGVTAGVITVTSAGNVSISGTGVYEFGAGATAASSGYYRSILNIGGNLSVSSTATFRCSDVDEWGLVVFNNNGTQTVNISNSATVSRLDYRVAANSLTQMLSNINVNYLTSTNYDEFFVDGILDAGATAQVTGNGFFTLNGTLRSANTNGIGATGTLAVPTARVTLDPASTVLFNAAVAQTFTSRSDYGNVSIDGGGDKSLDGNVTLSGTLNLINGKAILGTNNLVVGNTVTGGSTSNYVQTNGTGTLTVNNITTGKSLPVGNAAYNPLLIENGSGHNWSARVIEGLTASPGYNTDKAVLLQWDITPSVNPPAAGADITFQFDQSTQTGPQFSTATSVQAWRNPLDAGWVTAGSPTAVNVVNATTATVKVTGLTGFSKYALSNIDGPLPVSLLSFSGYKDGSRNQLSWTTASEINNRGFDVQRSVDGINYTSIGFVNSLATGGNSNDRLTYRFTDNTLAGVKQYYRLRQEDFDGRSKLSNIVLINGARPTVLALRNIFPNPAAATASMLIDAPEAATLTVQLIDMAGRHLQQQLVNVAEGSNTVALNIVSLQTGTYLVRVISENGEVQTGKLVKQ